MKIVAIVASMILAVISVAGKRHRHGVFQPRAFLSTRY